VLGFCTVHPEFVIGETKAVARMHTLWTNRPGLTRYEIGPFKQQKANVEEALQPVISIVFIYRHIFYISQFFEFI